MQQVLTTDLPAAALRTLLFKSVMAEEFAFFGPLIGPLCKVSHWDSSVGHPHARLQVLQTLITSLERMCVLPVLYASSPHAC